MNWPTVNTRETFGEMENRLGITKETNDIRQKSLGVHPSASFYSQKEMKINLVQMVPVSTE